jgi:hypothetical protein
MRRYIGISISFIVKTTFIKWQIVSNCIDMCVNKKIEFNNTSIDSIINT